MVPRQQMEMKMNQAQQEAAYLNSVAAELNYNVALILSQKADCYRSKASSVKKDAAKLKWLALAAQYDDEAQIVVATPVLNVN